jgi:hypothetical protein
MRLNSLLLSAILFLRTFVTSMPAPPPAPAPCPPQASPTTYTSLPGNSKQQKNKFFLSQIDCYLLVLKIGHIYIYIMLAFS